MIYILRTAKYGFIVDKYNTVIPMLCYAIKLACYRYDGRPAAQKS